MIRETQSCILQSRESFIRRQTCCSMNKLLPKTMELNSRNKRRLTPLDVLTLSQSEAGDQELEDLLRQAGATMTENFFYLANNAANIADQVQQSSPNVKSRPNLSSPISRIGDYFKYPKQDGKSNFLLIISTLIITATYHSMVNPPGGVWQQDNNKHIAGESITATKTPHAYKIYVFFNTL